MKTWVIIIIILSFCSWIGTAIASVRLREKKGYESSWILCLLFGPLALIYAAGLPDLILRKKLDQQNESKTRIPIRSVSEQKANENGTLSPSEAHTKQKPSVTHKWLCPNCGQLISEDECPFCGYKTE